MDGCLNMVAVDLGDSSGRVVLGGFDGKKIKLRETNRFPNIPVSTNHTLYWIFCIFTMR